MEQKKLEKQVSTLEKWDNAKEDWEDFCKDYNEWREKNGLEIEEEKLAVAFQRFRDELAANPGRRMSFSSYR